MDWKDAFEFARDAVTVVAPPAPLRGEDAAFQNYLRRAAQEERGPAILST